MAAAEDTDGDRVIEIVSAGALYRGGDWERLYWSCSRGKDRYPYPVGYQTVRHFSGISYTMEIQQGSRGPVFLVTSTEGDSATGQTPDIAWKNFQKKTGAKVRNWQRRRSFPQKIDGAEGDLTSNKQLIYIWLIVVHLILFGFKNASVQRLLRELIIDSTGAVVLNLPCPVTSDAASPSTNKDAADVSDAEDLPGCLDKTGGTAKRSMKPSQMEGASKRVHYQDSFASVDNCSESAQANANEGGPASKARLQDVSESRCLLPLLEEIPDNSKHTLVDDNLGEPPPSSSQQVGFSSGYSYLSSENSDLESAEKEVAKSMMSILLPQAIPLLKKSNKKKNKQKKNNKFSASVRTASAHNPSDHGCQGVTVPTTIVGGTNRNSSETYVYGGSLCDMVKHGSAHDDFTNDESVFKLDEMKDVVADSFEDDAQIWGANTSKPTGVHDHESDDACSREPNENSKVLDGKIAGYAEHFECQVGVHNSTITPDVVYDHEKGQYILSDSLLACLEEEFGGEDSSYPANYNQCNSDVEQMQVEQQFKDPTNCMKDGSSVSMDLPYNKNIDNGLVDVCAQASARHGPAVSSIGECLPNVLQAPVHSDEHNDTGKWSKFPVCSTLIGPTPSKAKSSLSLMRDEQHHTEVPAVNQKENRFYDVNDKCRKFDDPLAKSMSSCNSDDAEFVDKYVAFESSGKGKYSNDGSKRVNTITAWPVGDRTKAGKGNPLGKVQECQAQCRNGNETTMMYVGCESNVCEHIPPKGEHNIFHHQPHHTLSSSNNTSGLVSKYTETPARGSDHHLEFVGCYLHPMPVLSIMLNTKKHSSLYICVLCGFLEGCQRFLYVYTITPKDQQDAPPCFVGYTPLLLPSLEQSSTGKFLFGRSGVQFTPDGQFLVLLSSIRIPFCRMQSIDCSCSVCKLDGFEDNSLKIVSVNFGYVSLVTKLIPCGTVSCILICEPNYIVAAEDSRNLHIWKMVTGWSRIYEEYVIPSLGNEGPSILELRRMSKSNSLIVGHDGAGSFSLWDISKRTLVATFTAPGNIVFQILPVGFCSLQEDIIRAPVDDLENRLREITVRDMSREKDRESFLMPPREDIAVWVLVSSASVAEYQHDLRAKEHNAQWRLALLAKKRIFMGNILDPRATAVDASGNYGFAGTYEGLLYTWELSSGRKLASTQCINGGRVSCIAFDAKSGVVAVADDGCQLLLYTQKNQKEVLSSDAEGRGKMGTCWE
ncbi:uncharacterized protein LOC133909716 isoform X3 [Phragmites australis]|uniref:uncharacterized protein LOC133909716 isoform X3 n=1 Tax=Phragmites australis TaxID=29695 RepID=UPI002D769655|nr:uncharacterized protein LOC133909716 isoform X3 [Phragmites australis]